MFLSVSSPMSPLLPSVDPQDDASPVPCTFEPSIAVVVGLLAALLSLTFILVVYAQHCKTISNRIFRGRESSRSSSSNLPTAPLRLPPARFDDIDNGLPQRVIDALPTFLFSDLRGLNKQGLDCAVCLCKYEESDVLRLLPRCKHAFHVACVDKWLVSRPSCPLCRRYLSSEDVANVGDLVLQRDVEPSTYLAAVEAPAALQVVIESVDAGGTQEESLKQDGSPMQQQQQLTSVEHSTSADTADDDDQMGAIPQLRRCRIVVSDVLMQHRWSDFVRADVSLDLLQPEEPCAESGGSSSADTEAGAMKRSPSLNSLSKRSKSDIQRLVTSSSSSSTESQSEHHEEHHRWINMVQRTVNLLLRRDMMEQQPIGPSSSSSPLSKSPHTAASASESR